MATTSADVGSGLYAHPTLQCDLIMKGGITSGITYPKAVCEIAKTYRLRNLGGTSAGAIAAAAAAAAEVGRDVPGAGFGRLETLPERLAGKAPGQRDSVLLSLFRPSQLTRPYHRILIGAMQAGGSKAARALRLVAAVLGRSPLLSLAGALPGLVVAALLVWADVRSPALRSNAVAVAGIALGTVLALIVAVLGALVTAVTGLAKHAARDVPAAGFGIAPGFVAGDPLPPDDPRSQDLQKDEDGSIAPKPLTTWLADELDAIAGKTDGSPLTLGDLGAVQVNLRMFTTNLTLGTPYTLPFRDRSFFFSPDELRTRFPKRVVDWMVDHPAAPRPGSKDETTFERMKAHEPSLLPLPDPENFPVIVMTRFSLSFPGLLAAMPLWTIVGPSDDEEEEARESERSASGGNVNVKVIRCWFSDGGITSNFPIHFFDGPIPRWPTFGLNLAPSGNLDPTDQTKNIYAPHTNNEGVQARWGDIDSLPEFAHSLLDTMQNWMDNAQVRVPGYRDRIVTILHTRDEGGMNLDMQPKVITRFADRGAAAGDFLVNRFAHATSENPGDRLSWRNHRWLRYRTLMPLLENMLIRMAKVYRAPMEPAGTESYEELVNLPTDRAPSYRWKSAEQRRLAIELTPQVMDLGRLLGDLPEPVVPEGFSADLGVRPYRETWTDESRGAPFVPGAPRPRPALRIVRDF